MVVEKSHENDKSHYYVDKIEGDNKARKISWIVALIIIILSIFIAIVCTAVYTKQPSVPIEHDYVIQNWKKEPIRKITASKVGCTEYLTSYEFPGTVSGCNCKTSSSAEYSNKIYAEECSSDQESSGCKNINSSQQQHFYFWKIKSELLQLCVEREKGFNFMQSDCSIIGYKRCGVAKDDTTNTNPNVFCIPSNMDCPINSIIFGPTAPDASPPYVSIFDDGSSKIFTTSGSLNNKPLAFSRISRGRSECSDFNNYHFVDNGVQEYELIRGKDNTCKADQTDSRFKILLQIGEKDYLEANKQDKVTKNLPDYPNSLQYYLLTREYIPWTQIGDCRKNHMPTFIDLKSKSDTVNDLWIGCIVINWFVAIVYGFVTNAIRLKLSWKIKNWYIVPTVILLLAQVVMTIVTFAFTVDANIAIKNMSDSKCSDDLTNMFITKYSDDFNSSVLAFQIVLLVFVIVLMIFTIFFMRTIFMIVKLSNNGDVILPSSNMKKNKNTGGNSGKSNNIEGLLEERGFGAGGFYNTDVPEQQDGTVQQLEEIGSNDINSLKNKNINNGKTNQNDAADSPLVIKVNEDEQAKKGVLKRTGTNLTMKTVQINSQNQTPQHLNGQTPNQNKQTKFQEEHVNKNSEKNKDVEITQPTNSTNKANNTMANQSIMTTNSSAAFINNSNNKNNNSNNNSLMNNTNNKSSPAKLNKGKTVEFTDLENTDEKANFNTVKETNKSRNDLQLHVVSNNNSKSVSNLTSALPTPGKQMNTSQQELVAKSLVNLENLVNKDSNLNDLEFPSTYVPQQFEPGKAREKYLPHKFQKSQTRRLQSQHSIEADSEQFSPDKLKTFEKKLTNNLVYPEKSNNNIQSMNHLIDQNALTENNDEQEKTNNFY